MLRWDRSTSTYAASRAPPDSSLPQEQAARLGHANAQTVLRYADQHDTTTDAQIRARRRRKTHRALSRLTSPGSERSPSRPFTGSRRDPVKPPARAKAPTGEPGSSPQHRDRPRTWPLRGITDGWWAHLTSPFTAAGWTPDDLTWAIDHIPDGGQHRQRLANVRHPVGWLRWRLTQWLAPDGTPLPSRTAQRAASAARARADAETWRQQHRELAAGRSRDYAGNAARARAMLTAALAGSAAARSA